MIEIVIEEQLRIITSYSRDNEILQSFNKYSYLPLELVNLYNKNNTVTYLLNAKSILDYLEKIFQLVKFTKQTQIKIKDEQKKDKIKLNSTNIELSGHEKDYYIEMVYGKKLFPACKQLLSYSLAPKQLHDWVIEKENRIRDVTEPSEYNPKYPNTNVNELDIYRFMCMDLLNMFSYIFPNYFTTTRFFSNTGKSFLTLDDELYCYFIGNKKGYIPMIDKVPYFLREYDEEYYNRIFNDIKTLSDQISEAVQLSQIIPKKINNNDGTNPIFEKFFETHEITENIFDYLEKKGMIKKNTDGLYTLINNYQKKVISIFCYKCKSANPEYDLYKKIFPNFIRNQKEEYKKNGAKDPEYIKNTIIPFYKEICRGGNKLPLSPLDNSPYLYLILQPSSLIGLR